MYENSLILKKLKRGKCRRSRGLFASVRQIVHLFMYVCACVGHHRPCISVVRTKWRAKTIIKRAAVFGLSGCPAASPINRKGTSTIVVSTLAVTTGESQVSEQRLPFSFYYVHECVILSRSLWHVTGSVEWCHVNGWYVNKLKQKF